jgi:broad specificity phosphatase PhoE
LKDQLDDGSEVQKTPIVGESIADFYARTTQYWDEVVRKSSAEVEQVETTNQGESISTKDMIECEGFHLANVRYEEVEQIRERLDMLERLQLECDEKKAKKKSDKKLKKDRLR